jgi:hypothetical protein
VAAVDFFGFYPCLRHRACRTSAPNDGDSFHVVSLIWPCREGHLRLENPLRQSVPAVSFFPTQAGLCNESPVGHGAGRKIAPRRAGPPPSGYSVLTASRHPVHLACPFPLASRIFRNYDTRRDWIKDNATVKCWMRELEDFREIKTEGQTPSPPDPKIT